MQKVDSATGWSLGLWFVLGLIPTIGQCMGWHRLVEHQGLAAWVQAGGSILAIVGAAYMARMQIDAAATQTRLQIEAAAEQTRLQIDAAARLEQRHEQLARKSFFLHIVQIMGLAQNIGMYLRNPAVHQQLRTGAYRRDAFVKAGEELEQLMNAMYSDGLVRVLGALVRDLFQPLIQTLDGLSLFTPDDPRFLAQCGEAADLVDQLQGKLGMFRQALAPDGS